MGQKLRRRFLDGTDFCPNLDRGSLAGQHFSFMGSLVTPSMLEASARQVAAILRRDAVDTVFLTPV